MTTERIAEIKARADAASLGPWNDAWRGMVTDDHCVIATDIELSNSKFIAAARTDVPDLIAALEALQQRVRILEADYNSAGRRANALALRLDESERERDALKADRESWIAESHSVRVRSMYLDVQLTNVTSERDKARVERDVLRLEIDDMLASAERVAQYDRKRNNNNGR